MIRRQSTERRFLFGLLGILLGAAAARFYHLGQPDFWLDELHSLINSAGHRAEWEAFRPGEIITSRARFTELDSTSTPTGVIRTMRHDAHPPVYFVLLNLWRRATGDGEAEVRTPSVFFSLAALLFTVLAVRHVAGDSAALIAATISALQFTSVRMAQEARPYALGMMFVSIAAWTVATAERSWSSWSRHRRLVVCGVYTLSLLLSMLTHYFTAAALTALSMYAVVRFRGAQRWNFVAAIMASAALWCVIWFDAWRDQLDFIAHQPWLQDGGDGWGVRLCSRLADLPFRMLFSHEPFQSGVASAAAGLVLFAGLSLATIRAPQRSGLLFAAWFGTPAIAFAVIDAVTGRQTLSHLRYTSMAAPGLAAWMACVFATIGPRARAIVVTGMIGVMGVTLLPQLPTPRNPESRHAVEILREQAKPEDLLIINAIEWPEFWAGQLYLQINHYWPDMVADTLVLNAAPDPVVAREIASRRRIITVTVPHRDAGEVIPSSHFRTWSSNYVEQIGFVRVFEAPR